METRKYSDFTKGYARKHDLSEEVVEGIIGTMIANSYYRAIREGSCELKKIFVIDAYTRSFAKGEKVKPNNHDTRSMKKLMLTVSLPERFKEFDFIPEEKYVTSFQANILKKRKNE